MSFSYTVLKNTVNGKIHGKIGRLVDARDSINRGVRKAMAVPLKTLRRKYSVPIRLVDGIYDYTAPSDIQGHKVIDLVPVTGERTLKNGWLNVHPEAFDRMKNLSRNVLSVSSNGTSRLLKVSAIQDQSAAMLSACDSLAGDGTWSAVGTGSDITLDTTTYCYGTGSIKFNIGAGVKDGIALALTTAGDILDYQADGSVYWSLSLPSISGVTGATIRIGSSASNYNEMSVTSDINGNSLVAGFNLLKASLSAGTVTGTPDYDNIDYIAVLVDKSTGTLTGVRVDRIMVGVGTQNDLWYYSRHAWRTSGGTWQSDSTADSDVLNAEEEEYNLIVEACVMEAATDSREYADADRAELRFKEMARQYRLANPDASIPLTSDVYEFISH